jgi:hypothetical protein
MAGAGTTDIGDDQKVGLRSSVTMTKRRPDGLPKAIKIARGPHYCAKCGGLIKKGDKMTVRSPDSFGLTCLKCDGRYPEWVKAEGQDNPIGDDGSVLSGGARHR